MGTLATDPCHERGRLDANRYVRLAHITGVQKTSSTPLVSGCASAIACPWAAPTALKRWSLLCGYLQLADALSGSLSEILGNVEDALFAYEQAIRASPGSTQAMNSISAILRTREDFPKAIEYLNQILKLDAANGEAWGSLG